MSLTRKKRGFPPSERFALLGKFQLVPRLSADGQVYPDQWAIPGRWFATSQQLYEMAKRNNWLLSIHS